MWKYCVYGAWMEFLTVMWFLCMINDRSKQQKSRRKRSFHHKFPESTRTDDRRIIGKHLIIFLTMWWQNRNTTCRLNWAIICLSTRFLVIFDLWSSTLVNFACNLQDNFPQHTHPDSFYCVALTEVTLPLPRYHSYRRS